MTVVAFPFPGDAQTEPTLEAVRDHIKSATGVRPKDERITSTYIRHGLTGTEVTLRSGDDYRTDSNLGALRYVYGSVGNVSWQQNENGETVRDADVADDLGQPGEDDDTKATVTLAHVHAPAERYVISSLDALGNGTKEYVDPATWHVVREETVTPTEVTTTTFDDFRATAGYTRAWHIASSDGHPENDWTSTITSIDTLAVPAERFAVPPDRRALVEFPPGQSVVTLPARPVEEGLKFVVRVTIAGRGLDMLLDTGASGIALDRDVVKSLGIAEYDAYSTSANAGRYVGTRAIVPAISVGPLTMHDVEVDTIPHVDDDEQAYRVVGLLGFDFLDQLGVKLDYQHGTVTAYQPSAFVAPVADHKIALDVRLGDFTPLADVTVNGVVGKRFTLDTGGAGALVINDDFRRRYPQAVVDEDQTKDRKQTLVGVGGEFEANVCELSKVQIGNAHFDDIEALVLTSPALYSSQGDGTIGPDLLRAFTVDLDYQHRRIYMTPNDLGLDNIKW